MKAVQMICNRNCTLRTTYGSIAFEKDVPRSVSPQMVEAALGIGVLACDPDETLFEPEKDAPEPLDPGSRKAAITIAIEKIYARNDADDFTTGATPKNVAVCREAGFGKIGNHEIKAILDSRNTKALEARMAEDKARSAPVAEIDPPDDEC